MSNTRALEASQFQNFRLFLCMRDGQGVVKVSARSIHDRCGERTFEIR
jgi:hypothetical protein